MPRKKNDTPVEQSPVDPMATVIDEMPEPSPFADNISAPTMEDDGLDFSTSNGEADGFSLGDDEPQPATVEAETFNPAIHCVDANGNPKMTKAGKFRRKRGKANATPPPSDPTQIDPVRMQNAQVAAQVSTQATFIAGQLVFGPEGAPLEGEAESMNGAYTQFFYLSEKPIQIQPWMLVAMVSSAYIAKRMAMEEPRSRVMRGFDWVSGKLTYVWGMIWGA